MVLAERTIPPGGEAARIEVFPGLDAATYAAHPLHLGEMAWPEKNCYVDLWIELLHTLELEPLAVLPFTLAVDFEDDQWTFFKPQLQDLQDLYGIDVQELTVWRPMIEHAALHLARGKLISWEADAFWLPDTEATDYRTKHTKTTIVLATLDVDAEHLGYFHNAGFFELSGEDFRNLFRIGAPPDPNFLPLYAELVRIDRVVRKPRAELAAIAFDLLRRYHELRPLTNPVERFARSIDSDFHEIQGAGLDVYHQWAFANVRQAGSSCELSAAHLRWQAGFGHAGLVEAADAFDTLAQGMKAMVLKGARAVNSGRALDTASLRREFAPAWDRAMALVGAALA